MTAFLNATVNYTFVESWGYFNTETSEWSGMIGDLVGDRSEIGGNYTNNFSNYNIIR